MSDAAQPRKKQNWAIEKPRLEDSRRLRGDNFIDPKDEEFEEPCNTRIEKLGISMEPRCALQDQNVHVRSDL